MKTKTTTNLLQPLALVLLALCAWPARADVIMDWNGRADALAVEQRQTPVNHSRTLAMVHVAMFEAVNAIEQRYQPYRLKLITDHNTSKELAAAVAGHDVLLGLFPTQKESLDTLLAQTADGIAEGPARQRAILLGRKAAADLLALRAEDGSDAGEAWRPVTQPGVYIPTTIPLGSTVPGYKPWVMTSASQFRPGPPPSLTSETWTRDLNEIREVGGLTSKTRTPEQTAIAKFWFQTGPRTYNPFVRHLATAKQMDLVDCARLYALVTVAAADSFIAVFDGKYAYNFWRPVTAIRDADQTGNPATPRDATWMPLGETPMHPEYPCAHCISSAAVAAVLIGIVGDDVGEITLTSPSAPGVTRRWSRISDYRDEVSNARVWAGFHYRFSTEVGRDMGRKIGELTVATQMLPKKPGRK
ncbi:MAG TPA: vanadium-dependent haloperoxidase [Steroidobacteraceae bacterium]|nr:vanadium-dependent haloperoxidase [Steroidobacteraceae bacterium]